MTLDQAVFFGVLVTLAVLAVSLWRRARHNPSEFFPSQRARVLSAVRLRAAGMMAVAVGALCVQFVVNQQRQDALAAQELKLVQYESELQRLRVDYQLARREIAQLNAAPSEMTVASAAVSPTPEAVVASATVEELAQVSVARAVVRDRPAGRPQFTLTSGARVQLHGEPADSSGRKWREARTDDGRRGWIAVEVLSQVKG